MTGNNTLLVTCLYSNLYGTAIGGRHARLHHYLCSLKTLLNTNTDVVVYTSEHDKQNIENVAELKDHPRLKLIVEDVFSHPDHAYFQRKIKEQNIVNDDRCYEIMHSKPRWVRRHIEDGYKYIYWIDCGLSYGALFPEKYRGGHGYNFWFNCSLFNEKLITNLNAQSEKVSLLVADQKNHCMGPVPCDLFFGDSTDPRPYHYVVGGMFGGKTEAVAEFCAQYKEVFEQMKQHNILQSEELLLTVIYLKDSSKLNPLYFTTWHPEDSDMAKYNKDGDKHFYKIFEELNN
jgi:hypothetical protein